jgi:hypothetical protein
LGDPTEWDNEAFGILADLTHRQVPLVFLDDDLFAPVGEVWVPLMEHTNKALLYWTPHIAIHGLSMGPFVDANNNPLHPQTSEAVHVREICYLPPRYAAILMGRSISPAEAWREIGRTIHNDGLQQDCVELLNWLRQR